MGSEKQRFRVYGAAVVIPLTATFVRYVLIPVLGQYTVPFITYFPAVLIVAWYGGLVPGILSLLLSTSLAFYFFIAPAEVFAHGNSTDLAALLVFIVVGSGMAVLGGAHKKAVQLAEIEAASRKRLEYAEREQREWFETTLRSIGDGVIATDAEERIRFLNPVACSLTGWTAADAISKPLNEVFRIQNEETGALVENPVERVILQGAGATLPERTVLCAKSGEQIPIDDAIAPIRNNGSVVGAVLVFRDVTERRRSEREHDSLAAIVESSEDAIVSKSLEGVVQSWNAGAERLYGYSSGEMIGQSIGSLAPPDRQDEESRILERIRNGERLDHFETVRMRKGGAPIEVSLTISPVRDSMGRIVGASHVARDITELKNAAENLRQSQKLESLGVLAGGIAHDFNNLLVGILGNASLALELLPRSSSATRLIEGVISAGERAGELTRQMLAYAGKGRFVVRPIDISSRVRQTIPLIRSAIPHTVELQLDLAEDAPTIEADVSQFQQILMNLVINGAEAIPAGRPGKVTVTTRRLDSRVMLEVRDTGIGMEPKTKDRIFDPFFTTKFTGRGLGLAAVLGIVRSHSATIQVDSTPGEGSTFRVLFPASAPPNAPAAAEPVREPAIYSGTGTVLVIDDEPGVLNLARHVLEHSGYTVLVADDGARGVDVFLNHAASIRCVLLDMTMPVMSGEETFSRIKLLRPDVPIVVSSGFQEAEVARRFGNKGFTDFIQKPYIATTLTTKIGNAIANDGRGSSN